MFGFLYFSTYVNNFKVFICVCELFDGFFFMHEYLHVDIQWTLVKPNTVKPSYCLNQANVEVPISIYSL